VLLFPVIFVMNALNRITPIIQLHTKLQLSSDHGVLLLGS